MPTNRDWLPRRREELIGMAKKWVQVLGTRAQDWGIPPGEVSALSSLTTAADTVLAQAMSSERTAVITAQCKTAFEGLTEKMRFIKNRYFFSPPWKQRTLSSLASSPPIRKSPPPYPYLGARQKRTSPAPGCIFWNCTCAPSRTPRRIPTGGTTATASTGGSCPPAARQWMGLPGPSGNS